ncbi:WD40-repeat-containing domain protein [Stachybotrys elegans]|uniref:WD40-repeat-containing domain protein n=1 Tax=Stachybotrys elegans TaxID=80388 RepID=A0A8K0SZG0_9HYPO|nr:WD40-repeat-containing domain protein [Stachybotrys elegans]
MFRLSRSKFNHRSTGSPSSPKPSKGPLGLTTLYSPGDESTIADLIFVHGLGGGSHSTWRAMGDPSLFWPLEWLSTDPDFGQVSTHTFGYSSSWDKESILGIDDFANGLLRAVLNHPTISLHDQVPIIFVSHSMGGLVVKRMYVLAKSQPEYHSLANRIHSMFFLATPHHGADLARTLSRFLALGLGGARPFLSDLSSQSAVIQSLNQDFPHHSQQIHLFSFFETLPSDLGMKKSIIVDRSSAILGYPNERVDHLNANHRDMCKFSSRDDPNYRSVRNALATTIRDIQSKSLSLERKLDMGQQRLLESLLGTDDTTEEDLIAADGRRMHGSCEWIIQRTSFQTWLESTQSSVYGLSGQPGTGKTILSGRIVSHLRDITTQCSFYFFQYRRKGTSDISIFLLSMARQMALQDGEVWRRCASVYEADHNLSQRTYPTIWRRLFLDGIFASKLSRTHYWVLDALDECHQEPELIRLLLKASECTNLRVFFTSRNVFKSPDQPKTNTEIFVEEISRENSRSDIALFLQENMQQLPALNEESRLQTLDNVLEKSQGCFLWASLVLQELKKVHTAAEIQRVIDETPSDMNDLYARILDEMSVAAYGKRLAKAIITWTICATRPLTVTELEEALTLDLQDSIDSLETSIRSSCGHLIYVNKQSVVQMVHLTARDYLFEPKESSEFAVEEIQGHRRLLLTCLQYLHGDERRAARLGRSTHKSTKRSQTPFLKYASEAFHEHLRRMSWTDGTVLTALAKFFSSYSLLSWIEYIASHSDLSHLIDTGDALGLFLQGTPERDLADTADLALLNSWTTDLVRLVMQFGGNLRDYPASIFNLIPPFCPAATAPRRQFGSVPRGITVRGLRAVAWGDCLTTINNPRQQHSSIASSERHFALGCSSGKIMVYEHLLHRQIATLDHSEPVRLLCFGYQHDILASAGPAVIRIWNITSKLELMRFDAPWQCMTLAFAEQGRQLIAAMKDHQLKTWNLQEGTLDANTHWTKGLEGTALKLYRWPVTAALSLDTQLLAVVYKGQDILVWDTENDCLYDIFNRDSGATAFAGRPYATAGVRCLDFGTGANADLLAAAYVDGELVLFDISSGEVKKSGIDVFAHLITHSPDGLKLATADPSGAIQVFDFATLSLLYRIDSVEAGIQGLVFSGDGQHLLDIRGSRSRVWGPTVLVPKSHALSSVVVTPQEVNSEPLEDVAEITSIALHENGEMFFCGKEDGSIYLFETETGLATRTLCSHARNVKIRLLSYNSASACITSVDASSRILVHQLSSRDKTMTATKVLDYRANSAVAQIVSRPDLDRILVISVESTELLSISERDNTSLAILTDSEHHPCHWVDHPVHHNWLLCLSRKAAHIFDWQSLNRETVSGGIQLDVQIPLALSPKYAKPAFDNSLLAVMYGETDGLHSQSKLVLYNTSQIIPSTESLAPTLARQQLSEKAIRVVGPIGQGATERLVFIQNSNWVCTVDAKGSTEGRISSHFFFPVDWMSMASHSGLIVEVTRRGEVLMVRKDEVAVVRRGLNRTEFEEF